MSDRVKTLTDTTYPYDGNDLISTNNNGTPGTRTAVASYDYDAFGNETTAANDYYNPMRYCGEYFDEETGLIYLRARYYDPSIGRFVSEDPIKDGTNWYVYCGNNPIAFVDPLGLKEEGELVAVGSTSVFDVKIIQMRLNDLGYLDENGKVLDVDGKFGSNTLYAVKQFQQDNNLSVDGIVGDLTWKAMGLMLGTDITERLYNETLRGVYENFVETTPEGTILSGKVSAWDVMLFFGLMEKTGAAMDLKQFEEWQSAYFIFDNQIVRYDAPGNIAYGIAGKLLNIDEITLLSAAGFAQMMDGTSKQEWQNSFLYGDDPVDQLNIQIGFRYYEKRTNK